MSFSAPDWSLWVDRITAEIPAFQIVGLASDLTAAMKRGRATRASCAYVFPLSLRAKQPAMGSASRVTEVTWRVGVAFSVLHFADPQGTKATAQFETLQGALWDALIGWAPVAGGWSVELAGGKRLGFSDTVQWWLDEYTYQWRLQ